MNVYNIHVHLVHFRATNMNEHSSRSHAIFIVTIECSEVGDLCSGYLFPNTA